MTAIRILHIDDESDIREVVGLSLSLDPDLEVRTCASGREGLDALEEHKPDLILLDVMMPVMDGPTTLEHLRENSKTASIPVVFMTARAQSREIDRFKALGAVGVIPKPFDPMTLAASVRSHIPPKDDALAASRTVFLQRCNNDAFVLLQCWSVIKEEKVLPDTLGQIRDIAHGLAGAAGIFGFDQIQHGAVELEETAITQTKGGNAMPSIERALESLLIAISANEAGQIEQLRLRLTTKSRNTGNPVLVLPPRAGRALDQS